MDPVKDFDSTYRYILVAARRARQLQSGAAALVSSSSRKPCRIAREEIQAGMVTYVIPDPAQKAEAAKPETTEE